MAGGQPNATVLPGEAAGSLRILLAAPKELAERISCLLNLQHRTLERMKGPSLRALPPKVKRGGTEKVETKVETATISIPDREVVDLPPLSGAGLCSGDSHEDLIRNLQNAGTNPNPDSNANLNNLTPGPPPGFLRHPLALEAFTATDRAKYAPSASLPATLYADTALSLGFKAAMSPPHIHAGCIDRLAIPLEGLASARCLDVGCASGVVTAMMARMVQQGGGTTVGIEVTHHT